MISVRQAAEGDVEGILRLLGQVLEIHASLRPDVFVSGTTKYSREDIVNILADPLRRTYVAVDEENTVLGYALCLLREQPALPIMVPFRILYVDDLCVDAAVRGRHVGTVLFDYVKAEAKALGCYEITLTVWQGNDAARAFYDSMGLRPKSTTMELII